MRTRDFALFFVCCALIAFTVGCSQQAPAGPKPGTPEFFWGAAQAAYGAHDYNKVSDVLANIIGADAPFAAKARVMQVIVTSGKVQAWADLGDRYDASAKVNRQNPLALRKQASTVRTAATQASMQCIEALHRFLLSGEKEVPLPAAFPAAGSTEKPMQIAKLEKGILPPEAELAGFEKVMIEQGIASTAAKLVGVSDAEKAAAIYKSGSVPRDTFLRAAAQLLYDQSQMFGPKKLDQPQRVRVICDEALRALAAVPPTKESKALETKLKKAVSKLAPSV